MVLISGAPPALQSVLDGLEQLRERHGIRAAPRWVATRRAESTRAPHVVVHARAIDHAAESAPMSGEPLFRLRMGVRLPGASDGETDLWRELEAVTDEHGVDLEVDPAPSLDGESVLHGPERRSRSRDQA